MKNNIKRLFTIGALFTMFLVLTACTEADLTIDVDENTEMESVNAESTDDLSSYPKGVQEQNVSLEYFNVLMDYTDRTGQHAREMDAIRNGKTVLSDSQKQQLIEISEDFLVYLNGIRYDITNENEQEIDNYFTSVIYHQENTMEYTIKFLKGDTSYSASMKSEAESTKEQTQIWLKIMDKYELFKEE